MECYEVFSNKAYKHVERVKVCSRKEEKKMRQMVKGVIGAVKSLNVVSGVALKTEDLSTALTILLLTFLIEPALKPAKGPCSADRGPELSQALFCLPL